MSKKTALRIFMCLGINIVISAIAIFVFGTKIDVEDDYNIAFMAYGIVTEPSAYVYYTHYILGGIYKRLFELVPGFNWQTLIYYLGLNFSGTVGLYSVQLKKNKVLTMLWFLVEFVFFHEVYVFLTFSVVAAYAASQAYLSIFIMISEEKTRIWEYVVAGLALVFSSMVRFDSFLGISGFSAFVWLILVVFELKKVRNIKVILTKYLYPFAGVLIICMALFAADRNSYSKGGFKEYKEHESTRHIVTDYRNGISEGDFETLDSMGLNKSMALAVFEYRHDDPEVLNLEVLEKLASTTKKYNYLTSPYVWKEYGKQWKNVFSDHLEVYFVLATLVFLFCSVREKQKRFWPFLLLLPFGAEFFYFAYNGRTEGGAYPDRIVYVVMLGLVMGVIALYSNLVQDNMLALKIKISVMAVLILLAFIAQPFGDYKVDGLGLVKTRPIRKEYGFLGNEGKVYICDCSVSYFIAKSYGAWQMPEEGFLDQCVVIGDWLVKHPMYEQHQEALGVPNPYRALFSQDNVYFLTGENLEEVILTYLRENYDSRIDMSYIKDKGELRMYQYYLEDIDY